VAGAASALIFGTAITIGLGLRGLAVMIAFFVVGAAVTKLGYRTKEARGIAQLRDGARGWRNAWANGGVPALLAVLAGACAAGGCGEDGLPGLKLATGLFTLAYAASVATAATDTCSSEVGKAFGRGTVLITSFRPVPPGTEGGVSLEGTLGGLAGGVAVASVGALAGLYPDGRRGARVRVRVALVAAEHQDIPGPDAPLLSRHRHHHAARLAGEVLARARHVGHARDASSGGDLHAVQDHAGDRVGEELAHGAVPLAPEAQRRARVQAAGAARRRGQLLDRDLERRRDAVQHGQRRVGGAGLEVAPGRPRDAGEARHLLLGQAPRLAQVAHVGGEPHGQGLGHGPQDSHAPNRWQAG
jgi:uncharacterized protein (TIGR00297 family)